MKKKYVQTQCIDFTLDELLDKLGIELPENYQSVGVSDAYFSDADGQSTGIRIEIKSGISYAHS
jgi:hypothetical protein